MPLLTPVLDDRSFEQLRDELVRRIPTYTPEWTDTHPGDPGIALLELFAFLGEHVLFRFNQIPDATRVAFLRLLEIPLDPPQVAGGIVQLTPKGAAPVLVPRRSTVRAGKVPFQTVDEVLALPVELVAAVRAPAPLPDDEERRARAERAVQALALGADALPAYYELRTAAEDPAAPDAQPLDPSHSIDGQLWLALLRREGDDAEPDLAGSTLTVGFVPDPEVATMADAGSCPGDGELAPTPPMVWRATTGELVDGEPRYAPVTVVGDTTAGLTRQGTVSITVPDRIGVPVLADPALAGAGTFPPAFDDDRDERVLAWIPIGRPDGTAAPIARAGWLGVNAAEVEQVQEHPPELLGTGTGEAGQQLRLVHRGIRPGTVALDVEESGQWVRWSEIDDLAASPAGRHYLLDAEAGVVTFGDGIRGRAPQIGERIRVLAYRAGGGVEGNLAVGALTKVDVNGVEVANPWPTRGGAAAESMAEALERMPAELRRRDRAVTRGDFAELAARTPGAKVARAECLPLFDPRTPDLRRAGAVSVIVWPDEDRRHPDAPVPDRTTIAQVCRWLDQRRLVTTELFVIPPTYRRIAVSVGVQVKPGHGIEAVRRWVALVIRQFLAPLPPYGPEGGGWPLGRRVHGPELEAAALQVDGVEYLEGLRLAIEVTDGSGPARFEEQSDPPTVLLAPYEVPSLVGITVVAGPPLEPGESVEPAPPPQVPVPIPVERDVC
jgi:hypothetical protein